MASFNFRLCLYSAFLPCFKVQSALRSQSHSPTRTHTHIYTPMTPLLFYTGANLNLQEHCGVQCLAQAHNNTWEGKTGTEPAILRSRINSSTSAPQPSWYMKKKYVLIEICSTEPIFIHLFAKKLWKAGFLLAWVCGFSLIFFFFIVCAPLNVFLSEYFSIPVNLCNYIPTEGGINASFIYWNDEYDNTQLNRLHIGWQTHINLCPWLGCSESCVIKHCNMRKRINL